VQTCSKCNAQSPDFEKSCLNCGSNLSKFSSISVARKKFKENPRVKNIRLLIAADACPACREVEGTYDKDSIPELPVKGCSHNMGCRCYYEPTLNNIYP
jgi:hypothetical protein